MSLLCGPFARWIEFALYIGIAVATRVKSTKGFYVAGQGVPAIFNGMATAADWMSAASFISMAGLISFMGYTGGVYLMGWTGGPFCLRSSSHLISENSANLRFQTLWATAITQTPLAL